MPTFVIIREYSNCQGTFSTNESFVTCLEMAALAVEFYTQRNKDRIAAYQKFMSEEIPVWIQKNPASSFANEYEFMMATNKFAQKNAPTTDFDSDYYWISEELPELTLEDLVK